MLEEFKGQRALVTGAGKGIGRATALKLAQLGAKVFALSLLQSELDSLKAENPEIEILCVDLMDWTKTREAVRKVTPIHLLVNNLGVLKTNPLLDVTREEFDTLFNINVKSMLNVSQIVVQDLLRRDEKGNIVNVSSISAFRGLPQLGTYGATKGAMDSFTKTMAVEWSKAGIRVNSLNPTVILNEMGRKTMTKDGVGPKILKRTPQEKFAEIHHAVNGILFLLSEESDMINGHSLPLEGGLLCG